MATSGAVSHVQAQVSADDAGGCFGAAARDPQRACVDRAARLEVVPAPLLARTLPNTPCTLVAGTPDVCEFGADGRHATQTVALVGDSHAGHWRGAVTRVAQGHHWRGVSITHTSCPLSKAVRNLRGDARFQACVDWKHEVFAWFTHHPEIHTVFVAGLSGGTGVFPSGGRSEFETSVAGYLAAWKALPTTVRHIIVIRDTPKVLWTTDTCVARAQAAARAPGPACAVPRRLRLHPVRWSSPRNV